MMYHQIKIKLKGISLYPANTKKPPTLQLGAFCYGQKWALLGVYNLSTFNQ